MAKSIYLLPPYDEAIKAEVITTKKNKIYYQESISGILGKINVFEKGQEIEQNPFGENLIKPTICWTASPIIAKEHDFKIQSEFKN